ncbi:MAG: hypothetical protein ACKO2P_11715 [Planctomycetota bacterium]
MISHFREPENQNNSRRGVVTAEYLLLVTLIGIGVLVGLAALRNAIVAELTDCANAVKNIIP